MKSAMGSSLCAVNGGSSWCTYYGLFFHPHFSLPIAHYGQMERPIFSAVQLSRRLPSQQGWSRMVLTTVARDDASNEKSGVRLGIGGFILGILGVIGGPVSRLKGWMRCSRWWQIRLSAPALLFAGGDKTCRPGRCCRQWLRGGRIFPAVFVGVALGLMLLSTYPPFQRQ